MRDGDSYGIKREGIGNRMTAIKPRIISKRLKELESISLAYGSHGSRHEGMCALEAAAWIAGRQHTDHPPCVSDVCGTFGRSWNDSLDEEGRNRLIKPLLPDMIGTATTSADEETRAWMAADWLVRVHTPAWLRLAGLEEQAKLLESLSELNPETTPGIMPALEAIRSDAAAARAAAWDAAWAAARAAAWDAARAAAWDAAWAAAWAAARAAARDAARAAAWDAAWAAARDAAWAAARDAARDAAWAAARDAAWAAARAAAWDAARDAAKQKLAPTVAILQESAQQLLKRMCAVGRVEPVLVED